MLPQFVTSFPELTLQGQQTYKIFLYLKFVISYTKDMKQIAQRN